MVNLRSRRSSLDPSATPAAAGGKGQSRRIIVVASAVHTIAVLPIMLLGALAVLIRAELGFSETQLGAAVSLFLALSALGSIPGGRLVHAIGAYRSMSLLVVVDSLALLGIATLTTSYLHLVGWLVLAASVNALSQPSTSMAIAGGVRAERQGFAFGIKQSALPAATLLAGLAVPAVGLTIGWRWAYGGAAVLALLCTVAMPRGTVRRRPPPPPQGAARSTDFVVLLVLAIGAGLGTAGINALGAFYVESAVDHGIAAGAAGVWFAFGSATCIAARTGWGWYSDRRDGGDLVLVTYLMVAGAVGYALMPLASNALVFTVGTVLAFAAGWGWMGLFQLVVVRSNPAAPALALGITQTGAFVGAAVGPVSFGALVQYVSYPVAWTVSAAGLVAGAMFIRVGRSMMLRRRVTPASSAAPR